jgi:hypothetical protein
MEDVLDVYAKPYSAREPVVCFDEKPVPLHEDARAPKPPRPGHVAQRDYEYVRKGSANLFYSVEPLAGRHRVEATADRTAARTARALKHVADAYPEASTVHLVWDNLNTHCEKTLTDTFGQKKGHALWSRFTVHYTPKHGSWLDQAEVGLSVLSRQCLGKRRIATLPMLQRETATWRRDVNRQHLRFNWHFTSRKARATFHYSRRDMLRSKD